MILLDVNVLVHAHREDSIHHTDIRQWLEGRLARHSGVAVSELVLSGCLRVITHHKIFEVPTPPLDGISFIEDFRSRESVHILTPGPRHWMIFSDLCRKLQLRGNFIPDAYHAALAIEIGCQWATLDRGFSRFPDLQCYNPLDSTAKEDPKL